jgi:selenocysteine-specific elongation factor
LQPARRERLLEQLSSADPAGAVEALLQAEGELDASEAMLRAGAARLPDGVPRLGHRVVSSDRFTEFARIAVSTITDFHAQHPLENGMPKEALRATLQLDAEAFDDLVGAVPELAESGSTIALKSFAVSLSPEQQRARDAIAKQIDAAGFSPPLVSELEADEALVRSLTTTGELVKIDGFYLTKEGARRARDLVRDAIGKRGALTVAEIRDVLGTTRKYAVPLCEWLDATGATRRQGDLRNLGPSP